MVMDDKTFVRDMAGKLYRRAAKDPILVPRWARVAGAIATAAWIHCRVTANIWASMHTEPVYPEEKYVFMAGIAMTILMLLSAYRAGRKGGWRQW